MAGPHHQYNEHEFGQTLGDGEGQGDLACCNPWAHKESDMTEKLNNNNILRTRQWKIIKYFHKSSHLGWDSCQSGY